MKSRKLIISVCIIFAVIAAVLIILSSAKKKQSAEPTGMANPWKSFDTLEKAEAEAGFVLGMPQTVSDSYKAVSFETMTGETKILEVAFVDEGYRVEVRKSPGDGQNISGIYGFEISDIFDRNGTELKYSRPVGKSETPNAILLEFDYDGFSWSLYAPNGYWGDSGADFITAVLGA